MTEEYFVHGTFTVKSEVMRKFFESLAVLVSECRVHISHKGVYAIAVDVGNRALVETRLDKFITFVYGSDRETVLGLGVSHINKLLKAVDPCDLEGDITVSWYRENDQKILEISSGRYVLVFDCCDLGRVQDPNSPTLKLTSQFTSLGSILSHGVHLAGMLSYDCSLEVTKDSCIISGSDSISQCKYTINHEGGIPANSRYDYEFLKGITKVLVSSLITLEMSSDFPLGLTANDQSGLPPGLTIKYLIAPRITADDWRSHGKLR